MKNIYLESGYLNARAVLDFNTTFNFIVGARGVGKTYGFLSTALEDDHTFILMRRTQTQLDIINREEFSPFKVIERDFGIEVQHKSIGKYSTAYLVDDKIIGYSCALSTISNMRGFDASDVDILLYDEFIPEKHERPIKNEGAAFLNAYETINRNRELNGADPVKVVCMANAFDIANPIFLELGLVGIAEKMKLKDQEIYINRQRDISILLPKSEKITGRKKKTALYKLSEGSEYGNMALNNDFIYNPTDNIKPQNLTEYKPIVTVGEITIYKHKSKRLYYVSEHKTGTPAEFKTDEISLKRYITAYGYTFNRQYMANNFLFENILTKSLFELYTI